MPTVYITGKIPQLTQDLLTKKGFRVEVNNLERSLTKEELKKILKNYDAVLTLFTDQIDSETISVASGLKIIANFAVGFDNIDLLAAKRKGIIVTNTPGVASEAVAEHTFMLILACRKKLIEADRFVRMGKYQKWDPQGFVSKQIWGSVIGIVGLGAIGKIVGQIAYYGFKMKILYFDVIRSEDFELLTEAQFSDLQPLLKTADIVTIHLPLTPQTHHLIGRKELVMMKDSAILINTARGQVIDEEALIWALKEKRIAVAGLDVFANESHIPQELTTLSNVVLTPHIASATVECCQNMARIAAENIIAVFEGKTPPGLIKIS